MKAFWIHIVVVVLILIGIALAVANSLETFRAYEIEGGALALLDLVEIGPLAIAVVLIALITAANLGARYFKWMVLLRAGHVLAPSRRLFFSYLAAFIGNLTPVYILYVLRVAPLRERLIPALALLFVDLATDLIAVAWLGFAASYSLLFAALLVFAACACALAIFPSKSKDRRVRLAPLMTSLVFAQSFAILIWGFTGLSLWIALMFFDVRVSLPIPDAIAVYAASHFEGVASISLPGFLRVGRSMIAMLIDLGVSTETAVFAAALVRAFTYWLVILAALVGLSRIRRQSRASSTVTPVDAGATLTPVDAGVALTPVDAGAALTTEENHFDAIADDYRQNIPEHIRVRLLNRKIELNQAYLPGADFRSGVDAGCGQGWYLKEMLGRGYEVEGVDASRGQIQQATRYLGEADAGRVQQASITELPFADESRDFLYTINTIHHLPDVDSQFQAFREVRRILRPGGRFIIHEMNVKNPVFRFYMSYIFPLIKDIDDGTEVWLKETSGPIARGWRLVATEYRTFLPDFVPEFLYRRLWGLERFLESDPLTTKFSAHITFVLEKIDDEE
ncbi:MAG: methyltransferase domain-containing protein [bacterium]|nr:methyltransferase domain-containing protein [bacterium]